MAADSGVIVDTCMWVPFFNQPASAEKRAIDLLLNRDRVVMIGPVVAEILLGFKRREHAAWVASQLQGALWIEPTWQECCESAALGRELIAKGHVLPMTDLVIAAVAMSRNLAVYSSDPHFDPIPRLIRFHP